MAEQEYDDEEHTEPAHKRRKTGDDTFVAIGDHEAEDEDGEDYGDGEDMDPAHGHMMEEEDDMDGFIANEDEVEAEAEEERRRKRKRHRKKGRHRSRPKERISEDTLRMLAENQGKVYKPDIDIDAGLSDNDSDDSDGGGGGGRLKKRVVNFDEESVMDGGVESEDDFHDYGDDASVAPSQSQHSVNRNAAAHSVHDDGGYDDDFIVEDERPQSGPVRYGAYYEDSQIEKLYGIFGRHIYDFLGIPRGDGIDVADDVSTDNDDPEVADREAERKEKEAQENEERLVDIQKGIADLDPKQRQRVLKIVNEDIPERLQERIRKTDAAQIEDRQLQLEAQWILEQPYFEEVARQNRPMTEETVVLFLKYFRIRYLDVPYIVTYLQDEYPNDVQPADVWKIDQLDDQYQQIYLWRKNIEQGIYSQVRSKLQAHIARSARSGEAEGEESGSTRSVEREEHKRWLQRVEEADSMLYQATTHEQLEAVEKFLNIVPTTTEHDAVAGVSNGISALSTSNGPVFPQSPQELISADAIELIRRFKPESSERAALEELVNGQIEDKLRHNPTEQEMNEKRLDISELTRILEFYRECMNDIDNAHDKVLEYEFEGEEAFQFLGGSQTDLAELDENIRRIASKLAQMEEDHKKLEDEWEVQRVDYEAVRKYYTQCLEVMPKVKRTKKAASMLRSGRNARGRGAFKLAVPSAIVALCRNIGFSHIVSDNVKEHGRYDHGGVSCSNVQLEESELREMCAQIVAEHPTKYSAADEVETECVYHLARHIGHEPRVKAWVCRQLEAHGVISTQPTQRGRDLIEWTDELACVKRLEFKPISKFLNASSDSSRSAPPMTADGMGPDGQSPSQGAPKLHWLLIDKGTKQQLLKNMVSITDETLADVKGAYPEVDYVETYFGTEPNTIKFLLYKLAPMYISSSAKAEWKELRLKILKDALNLYLVPTALKWLKRKMLEHDEESVIEDAAAELKLLANVAGERANLRGKTLLSIIVGEESSPTFLVLLNHFGDVIDETMLHYMKTHIRLNPNSNTVISTHDRLQLEKKNGDLKLLREFVEQHKPSLIVIDAGNLLARNLKADIEKALASNDYSDATVRVEFVDPCISLLYRNSDDAIKEFQSWSVCQRQAVSLGRFVLDPITELTKRWAVDSKTGKNEMLSLPLHPNMADVDPNKLLAAFRKVLMDVTNEVGVLLNLSSHRDFMSGPTQFLSGLGPRKAKNLLFQLKQRGSFPNRAALKEVLEPVVYKNAIGFIRINRDLDRPSSKRDHRGHHDEEDDDDEMDEDQDDESKANLLDDTRIHPDDYHWAVVVIISAMDIDEESAYSNETLSTLRKAENLNKLEILNLDIFAERIRKRKGTRIVHKLYLIKQEVREGFKEMRERFESPGEGPLYHLLCGQTRASLREGMLVNVAIRSITSSGIRCKLPWCGLDAWLPAQNLSADIRAKFDDIRNRYNGENEEQCREERKELILIHIKQQTHLEARVISIDKGKFSVKLSCLAQDILNNDGLHEMPLNLDQYLNRNHPDDDSKKAVIRARKEAIKNRPLHRNIKYPFFFNITRSEAEKKLAAEGAMEVLFRPSSRGLSHLSMTWKMADNPDIIVHYVIEEKDKPNPYAIGKRLLIVPGKEVYEDLDEIYHDHIPKLKELVGYMIAHKNFRYGTETDMADMLKDDMNTNNKTCYALSYSYERPGHFLLSYMVPKRAKVSKEYIGLHYRGYKFRGFFFDDPTKLMNWFKMNFKKNHPKYMRREQQLKKQRAMEGANLNAAAPYMHPGRQHNLAMHGGRAGPVPPGGAPPMGPPAGASLNDDVMFNNNGFAPHHQNGGHRPPPHHQNGSYRGRPPPHHGGYNNHRGGHSNGYGHNGHHPHHNQYGNNGHPGGHRRSRSSSRSRERSHGAPYGQQQHGRY